LIPLFLIIIAISLYNIIPLLKWTKEAYNEIT
jgi:hypothetical protein